MKILMCHNYYQQAGGEDQVFADEAWLLRENGHDVVQYTRHNDDVDNLSQWQKFRKTMWNHDTVVDIERLIREHQPQIMHCTNTFPLISPSAYHTAQEHGVKVVQSIHNYRLMCPAATLLRDGKVCEDCIGRVIAWPGIVHKCYREDRKATAVLALYQTYHRWRKTWHRDVDRIIALTDFSREKLVAGGLPGNKMSVKRNFVHPDPGLGEGQGDYVLSAGRLSPEKGIDTLIQAWRRQSDLPTLKIIGSGPLEEQVRQAADELPHVEYLGRKPLDEVYNLLGQARCLIVPSVWYEVCPKTILESFAKGTPVIASRLGGMAELIDDERTGLLFEPGDPASLAAAVTKLVADPGRQEIYRSAARAEFETHYTAPMNYQQLIEIYRLALGA
ncbi:MAG: glycosyltransferase [Planctomycetales bacterium]|nr:glycosyltransferase [Planctomycetales bacterium]